MLFEKIFKYFAVMATVCTPMNIIQDFLIDSGADRNLISQKDLPDQCYKDYYLYNILKKY
jgi:hypothetical protein